MDTFNDELNVKIISLSNEKHQKQKLYKQQHVTAQISTSSGEFSDFIVAKEYKLEIQKLRVQIMQCEKSMHMLVSHYVSILETERQEVNIAKSLVKKQGELISKLESRLKRRAIIFQKQQNLIIPLEQQIVEREGKKELFDDLIREIDLLTSKPTNHEETIRKHRPLLALYRNIANAKHTKSLEERPLGTRVNHYPPPQRPPPRYPPPLLPVKINSTVDYV